MTYVNDGNAVSCILQTGVARLDFRHFLPCASGWIHDEHGISPTCFDLFHDPAL